MSMKSVILSAVDKFLENFEKFGFSDLSITIFIYRGNELANLICADFLMPP